MNLSVNQRPGRNPDENGANESCSNQSQGDPNEITKTAANNCQSVPMKHSLFEEYSTMAPKCD